MAVSIPKPTAENVQELHQKLLKEWSNRFDLDQELSDLVHGRNEIDSLEDNKKRNVKKVEIHSRRAGGIIEHAAGLIMTLPSFEVKPVTLSTEEAIEADKIEAMLAKVFENQLIKNDFWPAVSRDILTYGRALMKVLPLPVVWTTEYGYPARGKTEKGDEYLKRVRDWKSIEGDFPFAIMHIPVMNCLPLIDANDEILCAIEEKMVAACVLADEMKSSTVKAMLASGEVKWYDQLLCVEYTDPRYVGYYLVKGDNSTPVTEQNPYSLLSSPTNKYEELRVWEHGLGRCPLLLIPGIRTELQDKEGRYKSFIADAKEGLEAYDMLISRLALMVWAYYMPSYIWKMADSAAMYEGRERPSLKINLGGVTPEMADEEIRTLPIPENLPDAVLLTREVDDLIQRHTLEDVLFGRVEGAAPAFQVNLRINVAKSKLTPIAQHMSQGVTNVMDLFLRSVIVLGEEVPLAGESITPAQAKKALGRVAASIEPKSPSDLAQDFGVAKMAQDFGLPDVWIMEKLLNIDNAGTVQLMKVIQDLQRTPEAMQPILNEALDQLGLLVEQDEFEDAIPEDFAGLPPEAQEALMSIMGQMEPEGMGRGPWPEGGAPVTIQGGRGLLTPKTQPQPSAPGPSTA